MVALKLLRREVMDQSGMLDRFRQEVKLARRVTHRNVARHVALVGKRRHLGLDRARRNLGTCL